MKVINLYFVSNNVIKGKCKEIFRIEDVKVFVEFRWFVLSCECVECCRLEVCFESIGNYISIKFLYKSCYFFDGWICI